MSYEAKLPPDFRNWPDTAQAAWIQQGPLTQREMLHFAADEVGVSADFDDRGALTNSDLGKFVTALIAPEGATECSLHT